MAPTAGIVVTRAGLAAPAGVDLSEIESLLTASGATMSPLFVESARTAAASGNLEADDESAELSSYFHVDADDDQLDALAEALIGQDIVEAAYVKPPAEPAAMVLDRPGVDQTGAVVLNDMQPQAAEAPAVTPDFTARQGYLDGAPGGIDARYAWTVPGGSGANVRVIDCEWGWRFTHEDLGVNQGGVVVGVGSTTDNHGTAVLGEISGDRTTFGVTGIAPDAVISAAAFSMPTATVIRSAADRLGPGDILLLEIHRGGPAMPVPPMGQAGFIAVEWWPDDFAAIRYAVNKGVIVVEAAGNGAQNFDNPLYDVRPAGFPASWTNPLNPANPSSGAVVVGAGAPPPGTHGRNHGTDRSRLEFSNYGDRVDTQGWGREVTSTGYGDLQGGVNADLWYTDTFSGTSSASPIVVGALACVQGALRAAGRIPLTPASAIDLLRTTGSPQQDTPGRPATQRIGKRPNLRQLMDAALGTMAPWVGVQFTGRLAARQTSCWFTFNWPADWHVIWTVVPTSPRNGAPQITWRTKVERASDRHATYWICITNLTDTAVDIEGRYAVLGR